MKEQISENNTTAVIFATGKPLQAKPICVKYLIAASVFQMKLIGQGWKPNPMLQTSSMASPVYHAFSFSHDRFSCISTV